MTADGNSDVLGSEYPYAVAQSLGMFLEAAVVRPVVQ